MGKLPQELKDIIMRAAESQIPYQGRKSTEPMMKVDYDKEARFFRQAVLEVEPDFNVEKADKRILNSIFAWVWKNSKMNTLGLDFNKGLFFYGSLGRGKTMTLLALRKYLIGLHNRTCQMKRSDYRLGTYWKSASELANLYAADGQPALTEFFNRDCCLFIDELGREPNPANNFGTKLDVIQFLLQMRYDHRHTSVTHITTNLSLEDMARVYGNYIADRCLELFNFIEFRGESFRR